MVPTKCPNIQLEIENKEIYTQEYNTYKNKIKKNSNFKGVMFLVYMLYFVLLYYLAIPYMANLRDTSEWYKKFMDFIFMPAPHVCISIYLYGIGLLVITSILSYIRYCLVIPENKLATLVNGVKSDIQSFLVFFFVPVFVAAILRLSDTVFGNLLYIIIIFVIIFFAYIIILVKLTMDTPEIEKPNVPFGIKDEDKLIIKNRNFAKMPPDIAEEVRRQDSEWNRLTSSDETSKTPVTSNTENSNKTQKQEKTDYTKIIEQGRNDILNNAMEELNSLIGMNELKLEVKKFIADIQMKKKKEEYGIISDQSASLHMVFEGPPGTGKTTVARIMGKILFGVGYLSKGNLIEVDRSDLIGEYVGHTAPKVKTAFDRAKGGVLFIDEAYSLIPQKDGRGFEQEAIDTIVKLMEDRRKDTVVIFAGYEDEMREFVRCNTGLQSRIPYTFTFQPYSAEELYEIFLLMVPERYKIAIEDQAFAKECVYNLAPYLKKSNARDVRNFCEQIQKEQNYRLTTEYAEKAATGKQKKLTEKEKKEEIKNLTTFKKHEIEVAYNFIIKKNNLQYLGG